MRHPGKKFRPHPVIVAIIALLFVTVAPAQDTPANPNKAEGELIAKIRTGADLGHETIPDGFVEKLLTGHYKIPAFPNNEVHINNATFTKPFSLRNRTIPLEVHLENCTFSGPVDLSLSHFLELFLNGSHFLADEANFNGLHVDANLYLERTEFKGRPMFYHLIVGGDLHGVQSEFTNADWEVPFAQSEVTGKLFFNGARFAGGLSLADVTVRGLNLDAVSIKRKLDLSHAKVETVFNLTFAGGDPESTELEGLHYDDLQSVAVGEALLRLINNSPFSARSYSQLEDFHKTHGDPKRANDVFYAMKAKERKLLPTRGQIFSYILYQLVRYGREPARALIPSLFVIAFGTLFFWRSKEQMVRRRPGDPGREYNESWRNLDPFWYSLDVFAPVIDLEAATVWMPSPGWKLGWYYLRAQRMLGWILVPIIVAALTGIIK